MSSRPASRLAEARRHELIVPARVTDLDWSGLPQARPPRSCPDAEPAAPLRWVAPSGWGAHSGLPHAYREDLPAHRTSSSAKARVSLRVLNLSIAEACVDGAAKTSMRVRA